MVKWVENGCVGGMVEFNNFMDAGGLLQARDDDTDELRYYEGRYGVAIVIRR